MTPMDAPVIVVSNPAAGRGRAEGLARVAERRLAAAGREVRTLVTEQPRHAVDLVRAEPAAAGWVVVGGDGTLHEVVTGLMARDDRAPIALVPAGSGNALAHDLRLRDDLACVDALIAGSTTPLDVLRVDDADGHRHHAFNVVGYGMAADVARRAERWRRLGASRYTWASLVDVARGRAHDASVIVDDDVLEGPFLFVMACNTVHTGTGMAMAPDARFGDGEVDVVAVRPMGRLAMAKLLRRVYDGSHVDDERVAVHRARRVRIDSTTPDILNVDGEVSGASPTEITVLPGALALAAPG